MPTMYGYPSDRHLPVNTSPLQPDPIWSDRAVTHQLADALKEARAALLEANRNGYVNGHPTLAKMNDALSAYRDWTQN